MALAFRYAPLTFSSCRSPVVLYGQESPYLLNIAKVRRKSRSQKLYYLIDVKIKK